MLKGECQGLPVFSPSIVNTVDPPQPKQIEMPSTCPTFSSLARFYRNHCLWSHCGTTSRHKHKYYYNRKAKSHSEKAVYRLNRHKLFIHFNCQYSFRRFEWCHGFRRDENTSSSTLPPPPPQQTLIASSATSNMEKNELIPPINAESLEELSLPHLFKSLQLRHDLLSDPNLCFRPNLDGPSGREKRKKADRYWKRVDSVIKANEPIKYIKVIVGELVTILESLVDPFKSISVSKFHWEWPLYISSSDIRDIFDPDLILQQLAHNCLSIDKQVDILHLIFDSMCPDQHQIRIELMRRYFREHRYAKALDQCFKLLEIIKLDCANRALIHYRNYLIETCAEFEYRYFIKQYTRNTFDLTTTCRWFKDIIQLKKLDPSCRFEEIYYNGLINLMVNETQPYFPITLQFDERRLTNQFRFEFQNIIVIGILLMPYRHLAGSNLKKSEICKLKSIYTTLLKSDQQVSCRYLALHACEAAHVNTETAQFWEEWLSQQLQPTSSIFKIFYKRISAQLLSCLLNTSVDIMDVSDEVEQLGLKLKHIAKLNLDVYGVLYKEIVSQLVK